MNLEQHLPCRISGVKDGIRFPARLYKVLSWPRSTTSRKLIFLWLANSRRPVGHVAECRDQQDTLLRDIDEPLRIVCGELRAAIIGIEDLLVYILKDDDAKMN